MSHVASNAIIRLVRYLCAAVALAMVPACKGGFKNPFAKQETAEGADGDGQGDGQGDKLERRKKCERIAAASGGANPDTVVGACLEWSSEVVECRLGGGTAESCGGGAVAERPGEIPAGGRGLLWDYTFETRPGTVEVAPDGTVVAIVGEKLVGIRDGQDAWSQAGKFTALTPLPDGSLAVGIPGAMYGFQAATGAETFRVEFPAGPDSGDGPAKPIMVAATTLGSQLIVALNDARFFVIDPPTCQAQQPACVRPSGYLEDEFLDLKTGLIAAEDGTRFLIEGDTMRAFDAGMEQRFEISVRNQIWGVSPVPEGRLAINADDMVVLIDINECESEYGFKLDKGPKGCVLSRYREDLDEAAPAVIDSNTVAVNANLRLQAVGGSTDLWKTPLDSVGPVLTDGHGLLYVTCAGPQEGGPMLVRAVSADRGERAWELQLPFGPGDQLLANDAITMEIGGRMLVTGFDTKIAMIRLDPAPPPPPPPPPPAPAGEAPPAEPPAEEAPADAGGDPNG